MSPFVRRGDIIIERTTVLCTTQVKMFSCCIGDVLSSEYCTDKLIYFHWPHLKIGDELYRKKNIPYKTANPLAHRHAVYNIYPSVKAEWGPPVKQI